MVPENKLADRQFNCTHSLDRLLSRCFDQLNSNVKRVISYHVLSVECVLGVRCNWSRTTLLKNSSIESL